MSSPEQAKRHGIKRQVERAEQYCRENGLRLDDSLRDDGVSAFKGRHRTVDGALKRFVERVEAGEIAAGSYLLVESLDRLSREEVFDALTFFMRLIGLGLVIVTLGDGNRVYSRETLRGDQTQLLMSVLVMARAHEESATKSDRVGRAWAEKRRRARDEGQAMTARCPAWIRLVGGPRNGRYELIENRAEVVRSVFEKTLAGVGRRTIAKSLNEAGVKPWGSGKMWHDSYVAKILRNPAAYGAYTPLAKLAGGTDEVAAPIPGYFPAVVDEETFRCAQVTSKARGSKVGGTSPTYRNVLRGIAKCAACGSNMVFIDKGSRSSGPVLKCGRAHANAGCLQKKPYRYVLIEAGVFLGLTRYAAELASSARTELRRAEDAVSAARHTQDEAKGKLDRLIALYQTVEGLPIDQIVQARDEASRAEAAVAEAEAAIARAKLVDPMADVGSIRSAHEALEGLPTEEHAEARAGMHEKLKRLVTRIDVSDEGYLVQYADGTRTRGARLG